MARGVRWRAACALVLVVAAGRAAGQGEAMPDAAAPGERRGAPRFSEEIVVKGMRPPRLDTLEVREVRETSARDLGEALEAIENVDKVRKAGTANDVVIRGMKRDELNVIIDGAQVHGACPSRMDPPVFHLDYAEVDRVEVRKGPFDVTSPGGLGGTVDVRTRRARPGFGAELNLEAGSWSTFAGSAVGSYAEEPFDLQVGGAYKYAEPYVSGDGKNVLLAVPATISGQPNPARFSNASGAQGAYSVGSAWVKGGLNPADGHRVEASYTHQSATDLLYPYLLMDGIDDTTDRLNVSWRLTGTGVLSSALAQLFWSHVGHDMDDRKRCSSAAAPGPCTGDLPRSYSMRSEASATTLGAKLQAGLAGPAELLFGADLLLRSWDNVTTRIVRSSPGLPYVPEASVPDVDILDVGVFVQARRAIAEPLLVTAGVRLDVASTTAHEDRTALYRVFHPGTDVSTSRTDFLLSGNLQLDWRVVEGGTLFAGYGHGSRVPDQQERYYALSGMMGKPAWVGFPALQPERSDELDMGFRYASAGFVFGAQAFHAWVTEYITLTSGTGTAPDGTVLPAKTYANVDARLYGGELGGRVALPAHLFLSAGAAYTRGVNSTTGGDLAEIPPFKATGALRFELEAFFAEVEEVYAARQNLVDVSLGEQPTPAWFITNLRLGVTGYGLKAFVGVRNLFDKFYYEHLAYLRDPYATGTRVPEPGRAFYASVQGVF
jgi:iron complex outermembrane recepter protein